MAASIFTVEDAKRANINLTDGKKGLHALYLAVVAYQANRRSGTACTKSRGEVAGSGKKPWNQKGTGRARIGSIRAPHWRGGGIVFGPRPRDYSKKTPIKVKRLAFRAALTARINDGDLLVAPSIEITDGKTKTFLKTLKSLTEARKVLFIAEKFDEQTLRSASNVQGVMLARAGEVNGEHLLNYEKIIVAKDAFQTLANRTA
ncbi:MAG: 50S ribosomal protein L4 [Verrucomicrobiaceae bacterium]